MKASVLLLGMTLLLSGCRVELYNNLSEQDANHMLALLISQRISAEKVQSKDGSLQLRVEEEQFVNAVETLRQHGYPKKKFVSAEDFFPADQLISSPVQEKTRINYLKEQSLERMLSNIEGVITANVAIGQDVADSGFNEQAKPSASVLIKYSPEVNLKAFTVQIRKLMMNAIPGINDENVALMFQPVTQQFLSAGLLPQNLSQSLSDPAASQNRKGRWIWISSGTLAGLAIIAAAIVELCRRKRRDAGRIPHA